MDLLKLAQTAPDTSVTIKAGDLITALRWITEQSKPHPEWLSAKETIKMLDISEQTLWRWEKEYRLIPLREKGKRMFRYNDVLRIKNKIKTNNTMDGINMTVRETQLKKLRAYFINGGSLTSVEALNKFRVARLASRIWDLTQEGMKFNKKWESKINEENQTVTYIRYSLAKE